MERANMVEWKRHGCLERVRQHPAPAPYLPSIDIHVLGLQPQTISRKQTCAISRVPCRCSGRRGGAHSRNTIGRGHGFKAFVIFFGLGITIPNPSRQYP